MTSSSFPGCSGGRPCCSIPTTLLQGCQSNSPANADTRAYSLYNTTHLGARQSAQADFVDIARGFNRRASSPQDHLTTTHTQPQQREHTPHPPLPLPKSVLDPG